jgi:DNA-binding IscR family transcriptional regulator
MLHALLHMARRDGPVTSEVVARMLETNPVVVRRTMAGLRSAGFVRSVKGHGGGWQIDCDLREVSLLDVHRAIGGPKVFAIGNASQNPSCAVERIVNVALEKSLAQAEALLLERLGQVRLSDLANEFDRLAEAQPAQAAPRKSKRT